MEIDEAIGTFLRTRTAITEFVGDRFYPIERPQGSALPAIVYKLDDAESDQDLDNPTNCGISTIEIISFAQHYNTCWLMADALRLELQGFSLSLPDKEIHGIRLLSDRDRFLPPKDGSDTGIYAIVQYFEMMHDE